MNLVNKEYHKRARILFENWQEKGASSIDTADSFQDSLAQRTSLYLLKGDTSISEVNKLCKEVRNHNLESVCVNPALVEHAIQFAADDFPIATVVGFPLGANHPRTKVAEAELAVSQGAQILEMVMNVGLLKTSNFQEVFEEIRAVRYACPDIDLTVILETSLLEPLQLIIACMLCREAGVDDVKSSTGFINTEVSIQDVSLMNAVLGEDLGVIASGKIESKAMALSCLQVGASRLSLEFMSSGKSISDILELAEPKISTT